MNMSNNLIMDIYRNKKMIWQLAKNDFKTKFAGSYFGIIWAFVQPVITILLYWFVFQVVFQNGEWNSYPYVLGLITGLVPWFYFSEAFTAATSSLIDYSYLVKKIVFQIDVLPVIKIVSALFVHMFFLCFNILIFTINSYMPTIYLLQLIYYLFAMIVFVLGISYITSALSVFVKDLVQFINVLMQIWMWMTPILWNISTMPEKYEKYFEILKFNPLYYIVQGYRDTFINHMWFWEHPVYTLYYWIVVLVILFIGIKMFKKLQPHFADVL